MNREEAIRWLEATRDNTYRKSTVCQQYLNMAISALSAEGEYIKKEDALAQAKASYRVAETIEELANLYEDNLNSLPTYSFPDREKGEWIPIEKREPEDIGNYIVTLDYDVHGRVVSQCFYHGKTIRWADFNDSVTAWREDIEPYKAESEDKRGGKANE